MKHLLTFLRHGVSATLALTVGSPSFDRRYSALKHLAFMLLFLLGSLNVWGDPVVLFHETFGAGSTSATQTWSHSNGSQTGVDAVMANAGLTSSATNAKQSKQSDANNYTTGAGASLMGNAGSSSAAVTATYIVGPLVTTNCSDMVVSFAVKYGSVGASYFSNLYYSTNNSEWNQITTSGGPTTANTWGVKTSSGTIPAASTIWFKIEYSLGKKGGNPYIDEFDLSGTYSGSSKPTVKNVQFNPDGGSFLGSQNVTLSQEDNKDIYYTTDVTLGAGDPSIETWTPYSTAINLKATTTIYAAAKDGESWSSTTSKTFTKIEPLAAMDAIFAAATSAGSTETDVYITFNNWVVSGAKGKTAYVTDGTKGFIIYYDNHGFTEGDILSGTGSFKLKLYNGAAEITAKNSGTITITKDGSAPLNELDEAGIAALSGVNTGSLIKVSGAATQSGTKYYVADVQLYNTLCDYTAPTPSKNYECTGVYVYFKSGNNSAVNEVMPRKANDLEEIVPAGAPEFNPASKKFVGSISVELSQENDLPIYYTDDENLKNNPSTSTWTPYENAIPVNATKTIYAASKDGDNWSDVNSATYTKAEPLTTMEAVQEAATSTESNIDVTITNWVVTGIDGSQVWLTDASNEKGILLYKSGNEFAVNKKLNGTVFDTKIKLWNNYPELTSLVASDVSATDAEAITPRVTTIAALTSGHPAEQGTIVKLENLTYNGSVFSDGTNTITIDTRFFTPTLTNGKKYNLSGVVYYYGSNADNIKLMPRSADDVEELASMVLTSISLSGTYPTNFETGDEFSHEGMVVTAHYEGAAEETVTASATFSGYDMSVANTYTVTVSYTENEITKTADYTITVSDPAPTGDFELLEGELVEGDYLIYEGGSLMKAQIDKNRFYYEGATPDANGIISNPSQYAVWTLAKSGNYWTFYNAKAGKYAAATGASGKAQLMDSNSDDKAKWAVDGDLVVTNKYNTDNEENATLRHNFSGNKNYGFACYNATTGSKPVFYKRATPSYYISETLTGCTADAENAKKVPQALTEDVVLKYDLSVGYVWPENIIVKVGDATLDPNEVEYIWDNTKTPAELTIDYTLIDDDIEVTIAANERTLSSIAVEVAPTKVDYYVNSYFDPAGLQIKLNYTAGNPEYVTYNDLTEGDFTFSPDLSTALETTDVEVTITYGGKSTKQAISVTEPTPVAKTVVILAEFGSKLYAMSTNYSSSACAAIEVTKEGSNIIVTSAEDKEAIQWLMTTTEDNVTLQFADTKYLSSTSDNANLSKQDAATNWSVSQAEGKYLISIGSARALMYRKTNVFKHYSVNGSADEYAKVSEIIEVAENATNIIVTPPTPVLTEVRTGLTAGNYYTMCLEKAVTDVRGGSIWRVLSKAQNTLDIILEEVDGTLDAGRPYIFFATADKLEVVYEGAAVGAPITTGNNGLVGSFEKELIAPVATNYIIYNNALYFVNSANVYVGAHRAYLDMTGVPPYSNEPQQGNAPRRRVTMAVHGEQVATGMESIQPSEISNQKVLINGQLFIIRGEKMYDAKGQLVK